MEDCKIGSSGNCHLFGCARREAGKSYRAKVVENKSLDSDVTSLYKCNATRSPMCIWWLTMIPAIFSSYDLMNYWRFYGGFPWKRNREFRAADLLFYIWHLFYTFVLSTVKKKKVDMQTHFHSLMNFSVSRDRVWWCVWIHTVDLQAPRVLVWLVAAVRKTNGQIDLLIATRKERSGWKWEPDEA